MPPKKYGKDITSLEGGITFNLPDGTSKLFNNSEEALNWFNSNYGDGYSMQEHTLNNIPKETSLLPKSDFASRFYGISDWESLFGNTRIKGLQRSSNAIDNFKVAENVLEFSNIASAGLLNRLSPTLDIGLIKDAANGKNLMESWFGNSGIVTDKFAQEHPYWTLGINFLGDAGSYAGWNKLSRNLDLIAKLRHPTYKKYYHGTPHDFNLNEFRLGTKGDFGLHASDRYKGAAWAAEGRRGVVKEFWAPKPSLETLDLGANDVSHLSNNIILSIPRSSVHPTLFAGHDKFRVGLMKKYGGDAFGRVEYLPKTKEHPLGVTKVYGTEQDPNVLGNTPVEVPLRNEVWPDMPESAKLKADELLKRAKDDGIHIVPYKEINEEVSRLFSNYGKKVLKYNNTMSSEGGGGSSYIITDPSVIYLPKPLPTLAPFYMLRPQINSNLLNNK